MTSRAFAPCLSAFLLRGLDMPSSELATSVRRTKAARLQKDKYPCHAFCYGGNDPPVQQWPRLLWRKSICYGEYYQADEATQVKILSLVGGNGAEIPAAATFSCTAFNDAWPAADRGGADRVRHELATPERAAYGVDRSPNNGSQARSRVS